MSVNNASAPASEPGVSKFTVRAVDGVMWLEWVLGADISLEDAQAVGATMRRMSGNVPVPVMADIREVRSTSREARQYFATEGFTSAVAFLVASPLSRLMANFFMGLAKSKAPAKAFTDPRDALAWLKQ